MTDPPTPPYTEATVPEGVISEAVRAYVEAEGRWSTSVAVRAAAETAYAAGIAAGRAQAAADIRALRALIAEFVDPGECWFDHHGYCQAHGWTATTPACPHARAKALAAEGGGEADQSKERA